MLDNENTPLCTIVTLGRLLLLKTCAGKKYNHTRKNLANTGKPHGDPKKTATHKNGSNEEKQRS